MIYGIGVDLANIRRIEKVLIRWKDRFIKRVYTPEEAALCLGRPFPPSAFALRFAAKEAFSKALGLGMKKGVRWRDIEVYHAPSGKPELRLHGRSLEICRRNGIERVHLSLSDDGEYGVAMVVLETGAWKPGGVSAS
ncbi:MAG: holo-ACP synthase [Deltaproteobacteria bacterium]|nr:holo-ACP synthase [Deltaproteobacteria bacterium]